MQESSLMKSQYRIILYPFVFLVCLQIFCAYYNTFYNAKKYYNTAYNEIRRLNSIELSSKVRNNLELSIEKSLKLLELYPKSKYVDNALLILGKSYFYLEQYLRSRRYLNILILQKPESNLIPQAQLWLIKTEIADNKLHTAEVKIKDLLSEKVPDNIKAEVFFIQAQLYRDDRNYEKAIAYFNKCVSISKILHPEAFFEIGLIYDSLKNYKQSASYFKKVFRLNPDEPYNFQSRLKYGIALKNQNNLELALKNFDELLLKDLEETQKAKVHLQIADCLMKQGNFETSLLEYGDIIKNHPKTGESAVAYYQLGKFFEDKMRYKKALQNYLQVKNQSPRSVYVDSAKIRQDALYKLLALKEVISVSQRDSTETGEISNKIVFSDLDNSYFFRDSSNVSLVTHEQDDSVNTEIKQPKDSINANQLDQLSQNYLNDKNDKNDNSQKLQEVINPEINKVKTNELDKNLFLLSEIYMLHFNKPDTALATYKFLIDSLSESEYAPKAYFNTAYIYESIKNDSLRADSIYHLILDKFPNSDIAGQTRIKLGKKIIESDEQKITRLHSLAEKYIFDERSPQKACNIYTNIINKYPDSELLPKIYYALGWCYEYELDSLNAAYTTYDSLITKYPGSKYAKKIKEKVQQVKDFRKNETEKIKEANQVEVDSTQQQLKPENSIPQADTTTTDTLDPGIHDKELSQELNDKMQQLINDSTKSGKEFLEKNQSIKKHNSVPEK